MEESQMCSKKKRVKIAIEKEEEKPSTEKWKKKVRQWEKFFHSSFSQSRWKENCAIIKFNVLECGVGCKIL